VLRLTDGGGAGGGRFRRAASGGGRSVGQTPGPPAGTVTGATQPQADSERPGRLSGAPVADSDSRPCASGPGFRSYILTVCCLRARGRGGAAAASDRGSGGAPARAIRVLTVSESGPDSLVMISDDSPRMMMTAAAAVAAAARPPPRGGSRSRSESRPAGVTVPLARCRRVRVTLGRAHGRHAGSRPAGRGHGDRPGTCTTTRLSGAAARTRRLASTRAAGPGR
jgi:hypothetical protein